MKCQLKKLTPKRISILIYSHNDERHILAKYPSWKDIRASSLAINCVKGLSEGEKEGLLRNKVECVPQTTK